MFEVGEYVIYRSNGVCKVSDITYMGNGKDARRYYVLLPVKDKDGKIYTPIENKSPAMRKILSKDEAISLINNIPEIEEIHIDDEKKRESIYKDALRSCDCIQLVRLIKTIYIRNRERGQRGLKSTVVDERYFKQAEDSLYGELSFAIGKEQSEMTSYIETCIGNRAVN